MSTRPQQGVCCENREKGRTEHQDDDKYQKGKEDRFDLALALYDVRPLEVRPTEGH